MAALISGNRKLKVHDQQYKAYCVLPLPIHTHLPVHVNGMFELNQSRRDLSKCDDYALRGSGEDDSLIHEWNKQLIMNVIAPAYGKLLNVAGKMILEKNEDNLFFKDRISLYDGLFPKDLEKVYGEWQLLAKATFCYIGKKNLEVLPVVRHKRKGKEITWHHANSDTSLAFFNDLGRKDIPYWKDRSAVVTKETAPRTSTILREFLLKVGFNLIASCPELCKAFQACDVKAEFVSPQAVVRHLSSVHVIATSLPASLKDTAFKDLNTFCTLFDYCLNGITQQLS